MENKLVFYKNGKIVFEFDGTQSNKFFIFRGEIISFEDGEKLYKKGLIYLHNIKKGTNHYEIETLRFDTFDQIEISITKEYICDNIKYNHSVSELLEYALISHEFKILFKSINKISAELKEKISFLDELSEFCFDEAKQNGFHTEETEVNKDLSKYLMNLSSEISELWEAYRNNIINEHCDKSQKMIENGIEPLTNFEEELADIIIRAFDTAKSFNIKLSKAFISKILLNRLREKRNGGKLC